MITRGVIENDNNSGYDKSGSVFDEAEDPDTSVLRVQMADRKDREVTLADQEMMEGNEAVAASASAMEQAMARGRSNPHVNEKEEKEI